MSTIVTVGADCNDPTTGLQKLLTDAGNNTDIVIQMTTYNCSGQYLYPAGKTNVRIRSNGTRRPPIDTRDDGSTRWDRSKLYRSFYRFEGLFNGGLTSRTGNVDIVNYAPGQISYEFINPVWLMKQAKLSGSPVTVTGATFATPIVVTAPGHGFIVGQTACFTGVVGNDALNNGCFYPSAVTTDTMTLQRRDGFGLVNAAGSGVYVSGGTVRGLTWQSITPTTNSGRLFGACSTAAGWGHDTTAATAAAGMYRCVLDPLSGVTKWFKISSAGNWITMANQEASSAVIAADIGAHHLHVTGIEFPELPVEEEEFRYAPRRLNEAAASGAIYFGGDTSYNISFTGINGLSDGDKFKSGGAGVGLFGGRTANFELADSTASAMAYHYTHYPEYEIAATVVTMTESPGPIRIYNNGFGTSVLGQQMGGFVFFSEEGGTLQRNRHITYQRNSTTGALGWAHGSPYYAATRARLVKTRQFFECKSCDTGLIVGNSFDGIPVSVTPVSPAIVLGTQTGSTDLVNISAGGAATIQTYRTGPTNVSMEDRILIETYGVPGGIYRVASVSGRTINLKNLDGTAYDGGAKTNISICNIDGLYQVADFEIRSNTFRRMHVPIQLFGSSFAYGYRCAPRPATRFLIQNNLAEIEAIVQTNNDASRSTAPPHNLAVTGAWVRSYVDNVQWIHNTNRALNAEPAANATFNAAMWSDEASDALATGLVVRDNIFPATTSGVTGSELSLTGAAALNQRWPGGSTFTPNAYVRAGGAIAGEPPGTLFSTQAGLGFAATGDYRYLKISTYRTASSDGYPLGHDIQTLNVDQGRVQFIRATATAGMLIVRWAYDGGAACTVDASSDNWATYTRGASAVSTRQQFKALTLAAGVWQYQVLCPGTVDPFVVNTAIVP